MVPWNRPLPLPNSKTMITLAFLSTLRTSTNDTALLSKVREHGILFSHLHRRKVQHWFLSITSEEGRKLTIMEQSPSSEANSHSASQEIRLLWNPKMHYGTHSSPPMVLTLIQMHPVHTFPPNFPKILSNIILPSMPTSSEWSQPWIFYNQNTVFISLLISSSLFSPP
jgi:hypothetical protein